MKFERTLRKGARKTKGPGVMPHRMQEEVPGNGLPGEGGAAVNLELSALERTSTTCFPGGSAIKNPPASAGDVGSIPGSGRSPWRRKCQPTPVFLPGESHGQRSLAGYRP